MPGADARGQVTGGGAEGFDFVTAVGAQSLFELDQQLTEFKTENMYKYRRKRSKIQKNIDLNIRDGVMLHIDEFNSDTEAGKGITLQFAENAKLNLHIHILYGEDQHHKVEAAFKALARALKQAIALDVKTSEQIPSSKGIL